MGGGQRVQQQRPRGDKCRALRGLVHGVPSAHGLIYSGAKIALERSLRGQSAIQLSEQVDAKWSTAIAGGLPLKVPGVNRQRTGGNGRPQVLNERFTQALLYLRLLLLRVTCIHG